MGQRWQGEVNNHNGMGWAFGMGGQSASVYIKSDYHRRSVLVGLIGLNVDVLDLWDLRNDFGLKWVDCA